jgi:hypothetical protein
MWGKVGLVNGERRAPSVLRTAPPTSWGSVNFTFGINPTRSPNLLGELPEGLRGPPPRTLNLNHLRQLLPCFIGFLLAVPHRGIKPAFF